MKNKILFALSLIGVLAGLLSAFVYSREKAPPPPVFSPAPNPYSKGIYTQGIVESYQSSGANINIYPEVGGVIRKIDVAEGQFVHKDDVLIALDDTVQRATVAQEESQAQSAYALLQALRAQPRPETLKVAEAQLEAARANLKTAADQLDKQTRSFQLDPKSVSKDALDNASNARQVAQANLDVAQKQYELTKAGAWIYDIQNQEGQYNALAKAAAASRALLAKYTVRAPADGLILSITASVGSYVSSQGTYDTYNQAVAPVIVMGAPQDYLGVRAYVDEILLQRLPEPSHIRATMFIRGTSINCSLEFVRIQPYVSPKIQLSNQRAERVDVRVLPLIFKFSKSKDFNLYPGQLVDVYIEGR